MILKISDMSLHDNKPRKKKKKKLFHVHCLTYLLRKRKSTETHIKDKI